MNTSKVDAHSDSEFIFIILRVEGKISGNIHFKTSILTPMRDIKRSYSEQVGIPISSLRFFYQYKLVNDSDTLESLRRGITYVDALDRYKIRALVNAESYFITKMIGSHWKHVSFLIDDDVKFSSPRVFLPIENNRCEFIVKCHRKSIESSTLPTQNINRRIFPCVIETSKVDDGDSSEYIQFKVVKQNFDDIHFKVSPSSCLGEMKRSYSEQVGLPIASLMFFFNGHLIDDASTSKLVGLRNGDEIRAVSDEESFINYRMRCDDRTQECLILFPIHIQFKGLPREDRKILPENYSSNYDRIFSVDYTINPLRSMNDEIGITPPIYCSSHKK